MNLISCSCVSHIIPDGKCRQAHLNKKLKEGPICEVGLTFRPTSFKSFAHMVNSKVHILQGLGWLVAIQLFQALNGALFPAAHNSISTIVMSSEWAQN